MARSLLGARRVPRPSLLANPLKQGSVLPPAGARRPRRGSRGARREAPPPPYCTCPAEVRARNFAEPLRPVPARLSLLSPLPGERTRGGASPSLGLRSLRLGEGSAEETGFPPSPSLFAQRGEQRRGALES